MRHACDNLLTNLKANLAHIFAVDPWSMVSIDWNVLCFENWEVNRVSGRIHALMPLLSPQTFWDFFNATPSGKNTYEFNARFSQMKTSGRLFHAIQIFYKNNAIWDMHGREGSPF